MYSLMRLCAQSRAVKITPEMLTLSPACRLFTCSFVRGRVSSFILLSFF